MSALRSIGAALLASALAASAAAQTPPTAAEPAAPVGPAQPGQNAQPEFAVEVVTIPAMHALVLPMKGPYMQHPDAFQRLWGFISARALKPEGPMFGRYYSDPSVGEDNLVWEVGVPVAAGTTAEAPFEVKDIPASLTAVHAYSGSMEEIGTAWGTLVQWAMTNGYQPAVPVMQLFKGDMTTGTAQVEMRLPVLK
jgi:effector-binding domain-containing protein